MIVIEILAALGLIAFIGFIAVAANDYCTMRHAITELLDSTTDMLGQIIALDEDLAVTEANVDKLGDAVFGKTDNE